jgi:predicted transcriptional regulator
MAGSIYDFFTLPGQVREANIRDALFRETAYGRANSRQTWRNVSDGEARIVREKETVERAILRLAKGNRGFLTASELALDANIPMDEARNVLDTLVSKGFAELRVRKTGTLVYTIPEMMDDDSPFEDF